MDMAAIPALDSQRQSSIAPIVCVKKCEIDVRNREKATKKSETFISLTWRQLHSTVFTLDPENPTKYATHVQPRL